jgi:DNA-binding CsgD family transcriptional regulator
LATLPAHGDNDDPGHRELLGVRGILHLWTDDLSTAVENLRVRLRPSVLRGSCTPTPVEVLTASGPDGIEPNKLIILGFLAEAEYRRGHWDVAAALADHALALVEDTEQYWIAAFLHSVATLVPAGRGEWVSAEHHLLSARRAASQFGDELSRAYAESAAVYVAGCRGDADGVVTSAEWLLVQARPYHQEPGVHTWPTAYVGALLTLGRFAEADAAINRWEVQAQARGRRSRLAALARLRGELAARRRDTHAAREAFAVARETGEGVSDALERSLLLSSRGAFLRRRGERRAAAADLLAAEHLLLEVGAQPFLSGVQAELKACGLPAAPFAGGAPVPLLTPQELAVARLVVAGHNNQEIAARLFLSPKTVAYHLGHVYAKLGVSSRSRLAAGGLTALSAPRAPAAGR